MTGSEYSGWTSPNSFQWIHSLIKAAVVITFPSCAFFLSAPRIIKNCTTVLGWEEKKIFLEKEQGKKLTSSHQTTFCEVFTLSLQREKNNPWYVFWHREISPAKNNIQHFFYIHDPPFEKRKKNPSSLPTVYVCLVYLRMHKYWKILHAPFPHIISHSLYFSTSWKKVKAPWGRRK